VTKSKPAADASVSERKTSMGCRVLNGNGRAGEGRADTDAKRNAGKRPDENFCRTKKEYEILPLASCT
jgi:hypothetical protein